MLEYKTYTTKQDLHNRKMYFVSGGIPNKKC